MYPNVWLRLAVLIAFLALGLLAFLSDVLYFQNLLCGKNDPVMSTREHPNPTIAGEGRAYFAGDYTVKAPRLFFLGEVMPRGNLQFSLDASGQISFPSGLRQTLEKDNDVQPHVLYEMIHPHDVTSAGTSNELGPLVRIRFTWVNDGSPELYELALLRDGAGYENAGVTSTTSTTETQRVFSSPRSVTLVYAFATSNDGDPSSSRDDQAALVSFEPR